MTKPTWIKKQTFSDSFESVPYRPYDEMKDFVMEPTGCYVLIRVRDDMIELAVVTGGHEIVAEFSGKRAQDVYFSLFSYEKEHGKEWITAKDHIAYIGKELFRAEMCLTSGTEFVQR